MNPKKKKALAAKGWKAITVTEFLGLTPEEEAYIELKLILSERLKEQRKKMSLTQAQLAEKIHSDQSRVAKMEANDPSVSADLMLRTLFAMGLTPREVGKHLATA
jgi:DNA-binding XRE family transcriptional regulator